MKCTRVASLGVLLAASAALVASSAENPIRLPMQPTVPQPMPGPDFPVKLNAEHLFVIDSDIPVIVLSSPRGIVSITEESGPIRIRGKFVDGSGKVESRTFRGKSVVTVEPVVTGRIELLVIPHGSRNEVDIIRRTVDVESGLAPQPPPCPDPKPKPEPKNPVAWVVVVEETSQRTVETARVLGDLEYWKGLESRGVRWRFYDKDSPDAKARRYDVITSGNLPAILLLDSAGKDPRTGDEPKSIKLPKTTAEIDGLVNGVRK